MIHGTSNLSLEVNVWINRQETTGTNSILINTKGGSLLKVTHPLLMKNFINEVFFL